VSSLPPIRKPLLCYVTDRRGIGVAAEAQEKLLLAKIEQAAKAGVDWIQLREKDLSGKQLAGLASEAVRIVAGASGILINDRLDVACAVKAAGVHLGEQSLPVKEARRLVTERVAEKSFLVGASVHSLKTAQQAEQAGASYVIFGPVFATPSKAAFGEPQGLERLREICGQLKIPVLAIGGITLENARDCLDAGAGGIAAIRLFQEASDLPTVVRRLRSGL
jgi:thiamine-phosphate pyrophosphorylase